jgi:hypothetical protein
MGHTIDLSVDDISPPHRIFLRDQSNHDAVSPKDRLIGRHRECRHSGWFDLLFAPCTLSVWREADARSPIFHETSLEFRQLGGARFALRRQRSTR